MATAEQARCFLSRRPDIKGLICPNRPDVCAQGDLAVLQWWWSQVLIAPGTPDWDQKVAAGGNLDVFLQRQGCGAAGEGGGSGPPPPGPPPSGRCGPSQVDVLGACIDKPVAYVGGALLLIMLLRRR